MIPLLPPRRKLDSGLERVLRGMDATHGGIQYYAGQLSGFKAEMKDCFKVTKKLGENQDWDYCQGAHGKIPIWKSILGLCDRLTEHMKEHREAMKKDREERSVMVAELKKISSCLEAAGSRKELPSPPAVPPPWVRSRVEQPTTPPKATPLTPSMAGVEARQTLPAADRQIDRWTD